MFRFLKTAPRAALLIVMTAILARFLFSAIPTLVSVDSHAYMNTAMAMLSGHYSEAYKIGRAHV